MRPSGCEFIKDEARITTALCYVGTALGTAGHYEEALRNLQLAETRASSSTAILADEHLVKLADIAHTMGGALIALGRSDEAWASFRLGRSRYISCPGDHTLVVAKISVCIPSVLIIEGDLEAAAEELRVAEPTFKQRGWKDIEASDFHLAYGALEMERGNFQAALTRYEQCLALRREYYPTDHPHLGKTQDCFTSALTALGDDARASSLASTRVLRRSQIACAGLGCTRKLREDGAPLDQCAGCLRTYYCSVACQTADWKREGGHMAECKTLAAEGKAAAAAAAAAAGTATPAVRK